MTTTTKTRRIVNISGKALAWGETHGFAGLEAQIEQMRFAYASSGVKENKIAALEARIAKAQANLAELKGS